jgi:rubredoxin
VTVSEETQSDPETKRWLCETCGWVYNPEEGDEDGGVPKGTIPDDWMCPICGARKRDFREMEPGEEIPEDVN